MVRHDMHKAKEEAKSLQIRAALGIRYPNEIQTDQKRAEAKRLANLKQQAQGAPLGLEEIQ